MTQYSDSSGRAGRALRTTLVVSVVGYAAQGLSLVAIPLFLRTVGAEGYGLMVTVMAFMGYLGFADAGLSWGSMILIAQARGRNDRAGIAHIVRHSAVLALGSGAVALTGLAVVLMAAHAGWRLPMFSAHAESDRLLLIAGAQLALNLQFGIVYNLLQGLQEGDLAGLYSGAGRIAGLLAAMAAAASTGQVEAMMLAQLGCTAVAGLAASLHAWRRHRWAFAAGAWRDREQYAAQLRVGGKNFLLQIGRTLGGTAPTLAISSILGPALVPCYTVPFTLLSMAFAPLASWNASLQSAYGEAWTAGDRDWVRTVFRRTLEQMVVFGGLGVALFVGLAGAFIAWWTQGRILVPTSTIGSIVLIVTTGSLLGAGQFLLTGLNRHRRAAAAELTNGVLALLLIPVAVYGFGLGAVGVGVLAAALPTSGRALWRELTDLLGAEWLPSAGIWLRAAAALLTSVASVLAVTRTNSFPAGWPVLLAGAASGALAYGAVAVALGLARPGELAAQWRGMRPVRAASIGEDERINGLANERA